MDQGRLIATGVQVRIAIGDWVRISIEDQFRIAIKVDHIDIEFRLEGSGIINKVSFVTFLIVDNYIIHITVTRLHTIQLL